MRMWDKQIDGRTLLNLNLKYRIPIWDLQPFHKGLGEDHMLREDGLRKGSLGECRRGRLRKISKALLILQDDMALLKV